MTAYKLVPLMAKMPVETVACAARLKSMLEIAFPPSLSAPRSMSVSYICDPGKPTPVNPVPLPLSVARLTGVGRAAPVLPNWLVQSEAL